jgi:putative FmdB family regulatory protein
MPIFEFVCQECGKPFEELVRNAAETGDVICPLCGSGQVKKQISTFASKVAAGSLSSSFSSATSSACSTSGGV